MPLPDELANLLDYARAEAKRSQHAEVEPAHLVAAIPRLSGRSGSIDPTLVEKAQTRLTSLRSDPAGSPIDSPEITELLSRVSIQRDVWGALVRELEQSLSGDLEASASLPAIREEEPGGASKRQVSDDGHQDLPYALAAVGEIVEPRLDLLGRDDEIAEIVTLLARRTPKSPCVVGTPGSGRTALLSGLAAFLEALEPRRPLSGRRVVRIRAEAVIALRRAITLREAFDSAPPDLIIVLDDIEVLAALGGAYADLDMLGVVQAAVGNGSRLVVLTISDLHMGRLAMHNADLANDVVQVALPALDESTLRKVAGSMIESLGQFHDIEISQSATDEALSPPPVGATRIHPGLLVDRLDAACARAKLRGKDTVDAEDVEISSGEVPRVAVERRTLEEKLLGVIHGQDEAVSRVAARVALTKARLDLRPERPDGVFLFVGPTGVGKTALARAMAHELFGSEDALIRLDMSEYAHDWALSRLVGPQPGYVGYTEPEGWLTTQVRDQPHCVILLDEIEKAHPAVWNAFLQVFDAGRLTDARGVVASFADAVMVMTSNLGSAAFKGPQLGFGSRDDDTGPTDRVTESVRATLPPEFFNRIDETVVFRQLSANVIAGIAESEIERVLQRMSGQGYELVVPPEVVSLIATKGFDPSLGARHLQRNIERFLLETLIDMGPGQWSATLEGDAVKWIPSKQRAK